MERTVLFIKKMDCPSEEQTIRMKLADFKAVKRLDFNIEKRQVIIFHKGNLKSITKVIASLNFGSELLETGVYSGTVVEENNSSDNKLLWKVLIINFSVFVIEFTAGLIANSMGLIADALDELADAIVYAMAIYAISGTKIIKKRIARASGVIQVILATWGFIEIVRRFIGNEPLPNFVLMIVFSCIALAGNVTSLYLLRKSKSQEVHIKATQIFTSNDILVNIGVILAAILVVLISST